MRALLDLGLAAIASAPRPGAWTVASLAAGAAGLGLAAIHFDDEIAALPRVSLEHPTDIYDLQDIHRALRKPIPQYVDWTMDGYRLGGAAMKAFVKSVYPADHPDAPVGQARRELAVRVLSGDPEAFAVFLDYVMEHNPALGEALLFDTKGVEALVCTPPSSEPDAYPSHVYWLNPPEDVKADLRDQSIRSIVQAAVLERVLCGASTQFVRTRARPSRSSSGSIQPELEWGGPYTDKEVVTPTGERVSDAGTHGSWVTTTTYGPFSHPWVRMPLPAPKKKSRSRKRKA